MQAFITSTPRLSLIRLYSWGIQEYLAASIVSKCKICIETPQELSILNVNSVTLSTEFSFPILEWRFLRAGIPEGRPLSVLTASWWQRNCLTGPDKALQSCFLGGGGISLSGDKGIILSAHPFLTSQGTLTMNVLIRANCSDRH